MEQSSGAAEAVQNYNMVVARNIRAELAREGVNQTQAAVRLGVTPMWVSRRLSGKTPIDANDIRLFADFLRVPVDVLFINREAPGRSGSGDARGLRYLSLPDLDSNQEPAGDNSPAETGLLINAADRFTARATA